MALMYRKRRRTIDTAIYNERRTSEKPYPKQKSITNSRSRLNIQPNTRPNSRPNARPNAPPNARPNAQKQSHSNIRQKTMPTCNITIINDIQNTVNTPPPRSPPRSSITVCTSTSTTMVPTENRSSDDVICMTEHIRGHRPFTVFDIVSGRYPFKYTVINQNKQINKTISLM